MFAGFNLEIIGNVENLKTFADDGRRHLEEQKAKFSKGLKKYLLGKVINGTSLQKDWFPQIKADIFISHSHIDEDLALGLAGWLYTTFELNCFIDSCVWGYCDELLELLNDEYSDRREKKNGGVLYNHQKCNTASKHVSVMLMMALQKMIDKTEAVFLLNTDNSIEKYSDVYENATYSPWIYSEIVCTEIVRKKPLREYRQGLLQEDFINKSNFSNESYDLKALYKVSTKHLINLSDADLVNWVKKYNQNKIDYPLDGLYKNLNLLEEI